MAKEWKDIATKGRRVFISKFSDEKSGVPLILEEDVTLSFENEYEPLITKPQLPGILEALVQAVDLSTTVGIFGLQVWKGSSPIRLSMTFSFYPGIRFGNAKDDVWVPIMTLCALGLPSRGKDLFTPYAPPNNQADLFKLISDAVSKLGSLVAGNILGDGSSVFKGIGYDSLGGYKILMYGTSSLITLSNCIIKSAQPQFSFETDSEGFPLWGKVTLEVESTLPADDQILHLEGNQ